jgi:hypothetical protein
VGLLPRTNRDIQIFFLHLQESYPEILQMVGREEQYLVTWMEMQEPTAVSGSVFTCGILSTTRGQCEGLWNQFYQELVSPKIFDLVNPHAYFSIKNSKNLLQKSQEGGRVASGWKITHEPLLLLVVEDSSVNSLWLSFASSKKETCALGITDLSGYLYRLCRQRELFT